MGGLLTLFALVAIAYASSDDDDSSTTSGTSSFSADEFTGAVYEGYVLSGDHGTHFKRSQGGLGFEELTNLEIFGYAQFAFNSEGIVNFAFQLYQPGSCTDENCEDDGMPGAVVVENVGGVGVWKQTGKRELRLQVTATATATQESLAITCDFALIPDIDGNNQFALACGADVLVPGSVFPDVWAYERDDIVGFKREAKDADSSNGLYLISDTITRHEALEPFFGVHQPEDDDDSFIAAAFPNFASDDDDDSSSD